MYTHALTRTHAMLRHITHLRVGVVEHSREDVRALFDLSRSHTPDMVDVIL